MNENRITVWTALRHGDLFTRLSAVIMGAGLIGHRQRVKGILVLVLEGAFLFYMATVGMGRLGKLPSLGTQERSKVWNEAKQVYEYTEGDNSQRILLAGVVTCMVIAAFLLLWVIQLHHSYKLQKLIERGVEVPGIRQDVKNLLDRNLYITLMTLPCAGILVFNIVPLVYMISMAFTTYSKEGEHLILFDWDGLNQFKTVCNLG